MHFLRKRNEIIGTPALDKWIERSSTDEVIHRNEIDDLRTRRRQERFRFALPLRRHEEGPSVRTLGARYRNGDNCVERREETRVMKDAIHCVITRVREICRLVTSHFRLALYNDNHVRGIRSRDDVLGITRSTTALLRGPLKRLTDCSDV